MEGLHVEMPSLHAGMEGMRSEINYVRAERPPRKWRMKNLIWKMKNPVFWLAAHISVHSWHACCRLLPTKVILSSPGRQTMQFSSNACEHLRSKRVKTLSAIAAVLCVFAISSLAQAQ